MAETTTTRSTLDIVFHTNDGTTMGSSYTWKLNFPSLSPNLTLDHVKEAFDFQSNNDKMGKLINQHGLFPYTKDGYKIDGIDGARVVTTTTTRRELS